MSNCKVCEELTGARVNQNCYINPGLDDDAQDFLEDLELDDTSGDIPVCSNHYDYFKTQYRN